MIQFDRLEDERADLQRRYLTAAPFPHVAIDDFCDEGRLRAACSRIPDLDRKSRDYAFAHNKFEKSRYWELSEEFAELHEELRSDRFAALLAFITARDVFVDPENYGGGLHQGRESSRLDMHLDFNYHPLQPDWFREVNLLLYLNEGWEQHHGGALRLRDLRTDEEREVAVPFNRFVIQQTAAFTLHGYDTTSFPPGRYRTSIATYAYQRHKVRVERPRTTDWFPSEDSTLAKRALARCYGPVVRAKNKVLGSATAGNR